MMPDKDPKQQGRGADQPADRPESREVTPDAVGQEESLKVHGDKYEQLIPGAEKKPTDK